MPKCIESAGGTDRRNGVAPVDETRPSGATEECAHCGEPVATTEWHPIAVRNEGRVPEILTFCSTECRRRWKRGEATETG